MSFLKFRLPAALAMIGLASLVTFLQVKANEETDDQIVEEAVWNPDANDLAEINQACSNQQAPQYNHCFIEQMGNFASSDAVAFSQLLASQKTPHLGYLSGLREAGQVDLGYVAYPDGPEFSHGWVLLNGIPALVNVDDIHALPQAGMANDPQFKALSKNHPQVHLAVSNDLRMPDAVPEIESVGDGGERFIVPYALQENCAGCKPLGIASFAFDFGPTGKYLGAKFVKVTPQAQ